MNRKNISKYLKKGMKALAVALTAALALPAMPHISANAATLAEKAEEALLAKGEELAVEYAEAGFSYEFNYGLNDINNDGIPELFCKYVGDENNSEAITGDINLKIFGYDGKVKLLKKLNNVEYIKLNDDKLMVYRNVVENDPETGTGFYIQYRYETYTMTKSGKLKLKTVYKCVNLDEEEGGGYFRNRKKISGERFWNYATDFDYYEDADISMVSETANEIARFNGKVLSCKLVLAINSYQWVLLNEAQPQKTRYTAVLEKYTENGKEMVSQITVDRDELGDADIFGLSEDDDLPVKKIGKFDLGSLELLDTEEVYSVETVETSERYSTTGKISFKTVLRPSNASTVLPGFVYPDGGDVQGYDLLGTYVYDTATGSLSAEFFYSRKNPEGRYDTGLLVPLCVYTFTAE